MSLFKIQIQNKLHSEFIKSLTKQRHKGTNKKVRRQETKMAVGLWTILSFLIAYKMFGLRKKFLFSNFVKVLPPYKPVTTSFPNDDDNKYNKNRKYLLHGTLSVSMYPLV